MPKSKINYIDVYLSCIGKDKEIRLGLPVDAKRLGQVFSDLGIQKESDLQIKRLSSSYASISKCLSSADNLNALNKIAISLSSMEDYELVLACAIAEMDLSKFGKGALDVLMNVLEDEDNLTGFEVIDAFNETELGRYWAEEENLDIDSDEQLAAYGRENMEDGGKFTEWGYVRCKFKPTMYYDSDHLPAKHNVVKAALRSMELAAKRAYPAIYPHSFETAKLNGELEKFRASSEADRACAQAIDKAVQDSNFQLYHYDLPTAARTVIKEHGAERVQNVLAHILRHYDWDGRLSPNNKEWAKGFDLPRLSHPIVVNTHLAVLDGFINEVRKAVMEKALQPVQPGGTPGEYKYYATSRPIDVGTLPRKPKPERVVNFDSKRYVEDRSIAAWGYACYSEPLTKRQLSRYGLRGAASNPPERASVVEHLKSGRQQQEAQQKPTPKRDGPER